MRCSSRLTGVYDPKIFVLHAALRRQAFAHCEQFPTAASRRSLGRVSVPVWPSALSGRLPIVALVSHYLTNKLIGRGPLNKHQVLRSPALITARPRAGCYAVLAPLSEGYPPLEGRSPTRYSPVCHSTCGPKPAFAFDLHVLGTPPALILSQDQTLKLKTLTSGPPHGCPLANSQHESPMALALFSVSCQADTRTRLRPRPI